MFRFRYLAIPVLKITATDRIIDATTRLTTAIAGIQDAPPNKMEAIQSLCTLLLGKVAPFPPLTPSILPTPPPPTPVVNKDEAIIIGILNLFSLPCLLTTWTPTTSTSTATLLQSSRMTARMTHLSPVNTPSHLVTISFSHCKTILSHAIN
jgi:hypothetical protein